MDSNTCISQSRIIYIKELRVALQLLLQQQ